MSHAEYQILPFGMPIKSGQGASNCPLIRHCPVEVETLFSESKALEAKFKQKLWGFDRKMWGFGLAPTMLGQSSMTNKNSLYAILVTVVFAGIIAKLREAMDKKVPIGYQDENGFHLGVEPAAKSDDWHSAY